MDKIEQVAKAVQIKEGWFSPGGNYPKGSISFRCNNPGNILASALAKELGSTSEYKSSNGLTYAVFATEQDGFYALKKFLMWGFSGKLKSYKPEMTLAEFFKVYSGGGTTYGDFVSKKTGIPVETKVRNIYDEFWAEPVQYQVLSIENQNQPKYYAKYLGNSKTSMQSAGCKLFSVTAMYNLMFDKSMTVEEMNKKLLDGGAFYGDLLDDVKIAKVLGIKFLGKETDINKAPSYSPTIKEVDFSATAGKQQHFVLRIIKKDGTKAILDPWGGCERKINYYEAKVNNLDWKSGGFSYRLFKKAI